MKYVSVLVACLFSLTVVAQERFEILGRTPDIYIEHVVKDGETLQNIAKYFGLPPAKIAAFNSLNPAAPLNKNTRVKIPLSKENLLQQKKEDTQPVYHIIGGSDNLYQLSLLYNKVSIQQLKDWNGMKTDVVRNGQAVIVGYIGNKALSKPGVAIDATVATLSPTTKPDMNPRTLELAAKAVIEKQPHPADGGTSPKAQTSEAPPNPAEEGYFTNAYLQHNSEQLKQYRSGDAAFFKTVSGWVDHKYYVLMNDVLVGTIVRISAGAGAANKYICAKVLGPLQEMKGGANLLLRMSNSAALALGVTDTKLPITVTYYE